jgi:DNA-binding transcriptional LysR family regulator
LGIAVKFDIDSLRTLQTLADTGNLQTTADHLHLSRSAVSWKLKRLQERTGCTLVRREGRGLRLTDDGNELLTYGRQIIDAHDAAVRRFTPIDARGTVRVGATEGASATPLLDTVAPWFRRHSADVDLKISLEQPATLDEWLADGRIDLAVTIALETDITHDDVVLDRDDLVWAHSPGVDFLATPRLPLITWGPRCFFGTLASRLLTSADIDHTVNYELPTIAAVRTALTNGAGIALLNRGVIAATELATTGPPALPEAPRVAYVLRQRPDTTGNPLHDLVAEQIQTSFRPQYNGAPHR